MVHISCITCPRDLPDMYTHALGPNGPRTWVYISGKSLGYMIQLLHVDRDAYECDVVYRISSPLLYRLI